MFVWMQVGYGCVVGFFVLSLGFGFGGLVFDCWYCVFCVCRLSVNLRLVAVSGLFGLGFTLFVWICCRWCVGGDWFLALVSLVFIVNSVVDFDSCLILVY